jgi:signal transduction histidine kinase
MYAFVAAGVLLLVYLAVFGFADAMASGLVLGTVTVSIALIVASRRWIEDAAVVKDRVSQLATLGRFSAQMAHDVKNPLAALKGAAQMIKDDVTPRGAPLVALMLEQIDRLTRVVDTYGRVARVDLVRTPVDVNAIVRDVVALHALAPGGARELRIDLAEPVPMCRADRDMIASVIENLVRNALEAIPESGAVTVRTRVSADEGPFGVRVDVEDTGVGMDKLTQGRAFDDFFTTKPAGSGLGLAFVRRVVHAHGGEVKLTSEPGRGTLVRIRLPA